MIKIGLKTTYLDSNLDFLILFYLGSVSFIFLFFQLLFKKFSIKNLNLINNEKNVMTMRSFADYQIRNYKEEAKMVLSELPENYHLRKDYRRFRDWCAQIFDAA